MRDIYTRKSPRSGDCLIDKMGYYLELSRQDIDHLTDLQRQEQTWRVRDVVREMGAPTEMFYVVKTGWCFSYTIMADGRRQVLQIHHPGDVIGIPDIAYEHAVTGLQAATDICLCPFPKSRLDTIFTDSPRLTALIMTLGMIDHVVLLDRIRTIGRMNADERVAHFLLEILSRLRITNPDVGDSFELPLSQELIGDTLGLTNVYVSRTLSLMERAGLIERIDRSIRIADEQGLRDMADFQDRYYRIDTSWFPGGALEKLSAGV
ncbi:Crp/Fnr family transcriptional regulator (plasmid) [Tistrella mobilis]|uniref:Crp/Fnr family transcriptional regulator n=1 Tax=Tistrella mobilis TaxID=171437 RepID=UPI0035567B25